MEGIMTGIVCGIVAGAVNVAFLLFAPDLELAVYLSAGITWIVIGTLISICSLHVSGFVKGIIISILVSAPTLIYTAVSSPVGVIWTAAETIVIGAALGFAFEKVSKRALNNSTK